MQNKKQTTIERTLLIGAVVGLLIGVLSKRLATGLLTGIGLSILIGYLFRQSNEKQRD
jgi:ABC-type uncharacterized transport system permease subunit